MPLAGRVSIARGAGGSLDEGSLTGGGAGAGAGLAVTTGSAGSTMSALRDSGAEGSVTGADTDRFLSAYGTPAAAMTMPTAIAAAIRVRDDRRGDLSAPRVAPAVAGLTLLAESRSRLRR